MTSSPSYKIRRPLDPLEVGTRGKFLDEILELLRVDYRYSLAFAQMNEEFYADALHMREAIRAIGQVYKFEEVMPHADFYKQEIESAHRLISVTSDDPIPQVGRSRSARTTGDKRRK